MNITIIGTGNMGRGIGQRLAAGGHSLTLVGTSLEKAEKLAAELKPLAQKGAVVSAAAMDSVKLGDVVVLALKYGVNIEVAKQLGQRLAGRVVVELSNPLNATYDGLVTAANSSSAEELAKAVPAGVKVVKAFNVVFGGTLATGKVGGLPLDVLIAGDDGDAKKLVSQLVSDGGMTPVDAGPLQRARQLEAMALLIISLQMPHNLGFMSAFKLLK